MVVVEFYDHDTIGKDEKMGYAMFQLNELYVRIARTPMFC